MFHTASLSTQDTCLLQSLRGRLCCTGLLLSQLLVPCWGTTRQLLLRFVHSLPCLTCCTHGCAGATSSTLQKSYSGLCSKLAGAASLVAVAIGSAILAAGWGVRVPLL